MRNSRLDSFSSSRKIGIPVMLDTTWAISSTVRTICSLFALILPVLLHLGQLVFLELQLVAVLRPPFRTLDFDRLFLAFSTDRRSPVSMPVNSLGV